MLSVTATDLARLMVCEGSRLMEIPQISIRTDDTARKEGDAAHWLIQQVYNGQHAALDLVNKKASNGIFITAEMVEYLYDYISTLHGFSIETDTSYAGTNWQVNGRSDRIRYDAQTCILYVDDLKYGWGIIEPDGNWTLISHAVGWLAKNPDKPLSQIIMTIYQPRPHHSDGRVRSWTITGKELIDFYMQINATLSNPSDLLRTGDQCKNCPALANCPAARKAQMNAIDAAEMAYTDTLDNPTLAFTLDTLTRASNVLDQALKAYNELALHRARQGEIVPNYTIEQELTNRVWKEGISPQMLKAMTGLDLTKEPDLLTPKQAETAGAPKEIVAVFTERRNKGAKLVRISADKKARKMFETAT